jgi:hypothetical protein
MMWVFIFPVIAVATAAFLKRFERHLDDRTGPWIRQNATIDRSVALPGPMRPGKQ